MYFISESINDLQTLTREQIREIVAQDEFDTLATECGELNPGEVISSNWLAFYLPARRLAIASDSERNVSGLVLLASVNAGVTGEEINDAAKEAGLVEDEEDENFDPDARDELIPKIFRNKCEEKQVSVYVARGGNIWWEDAWEEQILELIVESAQEWESAEE